MLHTAVYHQIKPLLNLSRNTLVISETSQKNTSIANYPNYYFTMYDRATSIKLKVNKVMFCFDSYNGQYNKKVFESSEAIKMSLILACFKVA